MKPSMVSYMVQSHRLKRRSIRKIPEGDVWSLLRRIYPEYISTRTRNALSRHYAGRGNENMTIPQKVGLVPAARLVSDFESGFLWGVNDYGKTAHDELLSALLALRLVAS
jgi:hypothetical protein